MNVTSSSLSQENYLPQRIGLNYEKNELVIEYMLVSLQKLYHHKINLSQFSDDLSIESIVDDIFRNHSFYLNHPNVTRDYVLNAVNKLNQFKTRPQVQVIEVNREYNRQSSKDTNEESLESDEDYNKLSEEELQAKKKEMDKLYEANKRKVEDKDFEYDIRVSLIKNNTFLRKILILRYMMQNGMIKRNL